MNTLIQQFYSLHGVSTKREKLEEILTLAKRHNHTGIIFRLSKVLNDNPDADNFKLEIEQYPTGLNAPRHTGSYKVALDECGRLRKGFKFENGTVVKVEPKKKTNAQKGTKPKNKASKVVHKVEKTTKPTRTNVPEVKAASKSPRTGKPSNYGKKTTRVKEQTAKETRTFEKKTFAPEEWKKADTRKTTYLIKKYLKEKFGIDCKVKSEYYSGGSSLRISYDFGPSEKVVKADINRLQYGSFDGMNDLYEFKNEAESGIILEGYRLNEYKYVFVSREIPKSFYLKLAVLVSERDKFNDIPEFEGTEKALNETFPKMFGEFWTWGGLVRTKFYNANFATQNENEIQNLEVHGNYNDYYFTYTIKGKKYDSRQPAIYPTKMVKEKNIVKNLIKFIDYGKNEVAVIGYTGEIEDALTEIGGKKVNNIKFQGDNHSGFIFNKSKADEVANILIDYAQEDKNTGLSAPFHVGIARKALDSCSRLRKGYQYLPGGQIKKATPKKKVTNKRKVTTTKKTKSVKNEPQAYNLSDKVLDDPQRQALNDIVKKHKLDEKKVRFIYQQFFVNGNNIEAVEVHMSDNTRKAVKEFKLTQENRLYDFIDYDDSIEFFITNYGKQIIEKINNRYESLLNMKNNFSMFDSLNAPVEKIIIPVVSEIQTKAAPVNPVQHQEQKKYVPEQPKPVFQPDEVQEEITQKLTSGARRLLEADYDVLPIDGEWSELMQNPAANLKIAIWGKPKNGKTSGALQLAEYFTNFGKVLYNFADQGFNLSTRELWINSGLADNENAEPSDIDTLDALEKEIASGNYRFVFIDMISDYIRKEKLKPEEFKERFIKRYPNVSFILIFEVTKSGDFKGDQGWTHVVDAIMTVENFLMENRGRYGMGERIIWEEGFAKFNPKRYQELMEERENENMETAPVEKIVIN